jgi:isopropylmalate/homocitrate/citramalate synthase
VIWTGGLNDAYRLGGSVGLYDTTLRDGEQTVGVVLDPEQKLEIARRLDELGIDRIEAGFPRVSQDDWDAVKLISAAGLRAQVWGFSRAVPADLEALVELGVGASVIESPISDLKLNAIGVDREKMLGRITSAMRFAAEHGIHAAFFGVDSTRAEPDFYARAYTAAVEAGAKEVVAVDTLGIDRIEAGFSRVTNEDRLAIERIAAAGLAAEVWGFSRAVPADLEALVELGVAFSVIESPISDFKLDAIGVSRETMLERIASAMRFAADHDIHAAFFGVDSTRADPEFFGRVYQTAVESGAKEVVVVDTLGIASPEAVTDLVGATLQHVDGLPVHFHGHNDFGLATASAVAAVRAGASWVHGTINGMGERAGNADLGEIALALRALYGVETNLRFGRIRAAAERVRELSGYELAPWKPVTGGTLYRRESGAVASQFHDPPSIEPYSSELVGAERAIVLGKKSGLDSIRIKAEELGLDVPEERRAEVLAAVKRLGAAERRLVTDDEFRHLANG